MVDQRGRSITILAALASLPLWIACGARADEAGSKTPHSNGPRANAQRLEQRINALGRFGANPEGGVSRVAFSTADIAGREYIQSLMRDAGLEVQIDAAGNIIGRRAGTDPALPVIMTGSHIDSVPQGGNYDGDVGVLGAIEVAEMLREHDIVTRHPFEFVVFTDEEGGLGGLLRRDDPGLRRLAQGRLNPRAEFRSVRSGELPRPPQCGTPRPTSRRDG